ncbi:hypothetical protein N8J89_05310 [Crossiella sp. CA-258035]|uniref:hypothetical protein n=1 Tax=Crossiella sp. CA-258035 TaxID=2981138 RepID=UPI0024BC2ABD|nr:hypothetical protein [Crossiella sp. CA-258035]WHT20488.1 hypothetical protein N8J89_05310 [Crossiella sp. CA-258035]
MPLPLLLLAAGATAGGLTAAGLITVDTPRPEGHSGDQIYRWFHVEAKTPTAGLVPIEQTWAKAAKDYGLISEHIEKVITASRGVWQGEAAEAARRQLSPLAGYADTARTMAEGTAKAVAQQTTDWYGCKNRLKPVPADPPQDNLLNKIQPYTTDLDRQIEQFRAGTADNQLVLAGYGERKNDNVTKLPNWTTPQEAGGDVSVVRPGGGGRDGGRGRPGGGRTGGGYGRGVDGPGGGTGPGSGGGTGPGPVVPGGDRTDPAGWVAPQGGPAGGTGVGPAGGAGAGGAGAGGGAGLGGGQAGAGPGATGAGPGGLGAGFGAAPAGRGFGPGGSGSGTPGAGRPGGAAGVGRGGGPGAGSAGTSGARPGAAAVHGMPLAAGAPREEDLEHERPTYLLETEDLFGDSRSASPPVIGES